MKKRFLLLFILLLTATLFAQNTPLHFETEKHSSESRDIRNFEKTGFDQSSQYFNNNNKKQEFAHFKSENDLIWVEDSTYYFYWNEFLNLWFVSSKKLFIYDESGLIIEEYFYSWDPNLNQWNESFKRAYSYNENGLLSEKIKYDWNPDIEEWAKDSKEERFYIENELFTEKIN